MANLQQALDSVRNTARSFRAVIELADALEGIASIEQAVADSSTRLASLQREIGISQAQLNTAREAVTAANKSAQNIMASMNADKEDTIKRANDAASTTLAKAIEAKKAADEYVREHCGQADQRVRDMDDALKFKKQELNDTIAKIDAAKAKIASMLG